jgi:RNA exonuclease NGL2
MRALAGSAGWRQVTFRFKRGYWLRSDLNTQPSEATYQLLTSPSESLHPKTIEEVEASRLIHVSVEAVAQALDPQGAETATETEDKDDEGELPDHDERSTAKTRPPRDGDGILEVEELVKLMRETLPEGATSAISQMATNSSAGKSDSEPETFGTRGGLDGMTGFGRNEPAFTCFTPLFKLTLGKSGA